MSVSVVASGYDFLTSSKIIPEASCKDPGKVRYELPHIGLGVHELLSAHRLHIRHGIQPCSTYVLAPSAPPTWDPNTDGAPPAQAWPGGV